MNRSGILPLPPALVVIGLVLVLLTPIIVMAVISLGLDGISQAGLLTADARLWPCLITALVAGVISAWILALRPGDRIVWLFAVSGLSTYVFCLAAAAFLLPLELPPDAIFPLISANVVGASAFGITMIALFALYPSRLPQAALVIGTSLLIFGIWTGLAVVGPLDVMVEVHRITLLEMVMIILLAMMQIAASRNDPVARNIAIWLAACVGVGAGSFIVIIALPSAFGMASVIPGHFGFLFFIIIYVGLAIGLMRIRVFGLGRWAYQLLFNVGAALVVLALDAGLILLLSVDPGRAIGVSLFVVALAYLPARALIWERLARHGKDDPASLFRAVADVALQPTHVQREAAWRALLQDVYAPLEIREAEARFDGGDSEALGRVLHAPGPEQFMSLTLHDRDQGRSLFTPEDAASVRELSSLITYLGESRTSYDRGAAFERTRIARDIHDTIGAQLMTALHAPPGNRKDELIRETIGDLRDVIRNAEGEPVGLDALIADLRAETADRVEIAGLEFRWSSDPMRTDAPRRAGVHTLRGVLREAVSNALRYAQASRICVEIEAGDDAVVLRVADDGAGFDDTREERQADSSETDRRGLVNMRERVEALGGRFAIKTGKGGTRIEATVPLYAGADTPSALPAT